MKNDIFFVERNIRGVWTIYGRLGVRQYYGYTKKEAERKYREECGKTFFEQERKQNDERRT
jgi:hypothetical protein